MLNNKQGLISRLVAMRGDQDERIGLRLPFELKRKLMMLAAFEGLTLSAFVIKLLERAVTEYLGERPEVARAVDALMSQPED